MITSEHPDPDTLRMFALGTLDWNALELVEAHLCGCASCGEAALRVPDDRLVTLLRVPATRFGAFAREDSAKSSGNRAAQPRSEPCTQRPISRLRLLVLLAFATGVFGVFAPGCYDRVGEPDLSPEAQAKAKLAFRKRLAHYGTRADHKSARRRDR